MTPTRIFVPLFCDLDLEEVTSQGDNPSAVPHKPGFPMNAFAGPLLNLAPDGIGPDNLLLIIPDNAEGILPERLLCERLKCSKELSFPNDGGIIPESELLLRSNKYYGWSKDGIEPSNKLLLRSKKKNLERLPIRDGIDPLKLFPLRFKLRIPVHLQRFLRLLRDHEFREEDGDKVFFHCTRASASVVAEEEDFRGNKVTTRK
ncbi:hypothetical protein CDL12_23042 [Handroanthus impetiginosus]|uniref:Uncharacterized protein n=1 Tax=Handroanthus impetiginosus TaxID=429701 RepID=A0A2G9GGK2_9LAMI|nr:hypothetical protein CDL12_23042 [Handroanthus impetiginosus]